MGVSIAGVLVGLVAAVVEGSRFVMMKEVRNGLVRDSFNNYNGSLN